MRSQADCSTLGSQSSIPDKSTFCKISSGSVSSCWISSDKFACTDIHCTFSFSLKSCLSGICIDGTMLAAVTMPTLVLGSNVISLPDKFLRTTATPDPPGINLEVLPGTNILVHLGDGSTNNMDMLLVSSNFCEPSCYHCLKSRNYHFLGCYYFTFHLVQIKFLVTHLWWCWWYSRMPISRIVIVIVILPQ